MEYFTLSLLLIFMISSIYTMSNQAVMSRLLRSKGEKTIPMFFRPSDLKKFQSLINNENDEKKKQKMAAIKKWYLISLFITFSCFVLLAFFAFISPIG